MSLQRPFMASAVFVALPSTFHLCPAERTHPLPTCAHHRPLFPTFAHNCSGRTFVGQVSSQVLAAVGSTIKNVQTCIIKIKNFISFRPTLFQPLSPLLYRKRNKQKKKGKSWRMALIKCQYIFVFHNLINASGSQKRALVAA